MRSTVRPPVRHHRGGPRNHTLFWRIKAPNAGGDPSANSVGGFIDELAVYSGALSLSQIQAHYNAGRP